MKQKIMKYLLLLMGSFFFIRNEAFAQVEVKMNVSLTTLYNQKFDSLIKDMLNVELEFVNQGEQAQLLWMETWSFFLMKPRRADPFRRDGVHHNKLYITDENGTAVETRDLPVNACFVCWSPFFSNSTLKLLNPKDTFKVYFYTLDRDVIQLVKRANFKLIYKYFHVPFDPGFFEGCDNYKSLLYEKDFVILPELIFEDWRTAYCARVLFSSQDNQCSSFDILKFIRPAILKKTEQVFKAL